MRECTKCHKEKDISEFIKRKRGRDGITPYCKDCYKEHYEPSRDYFNAYNKTENGKRIKSEYQKRYRAKANARKAVAYAIAAGRLVKEPCAFCGTDEKIEAHHSDYSKPLDVVWYCQQHHARLHKELKASAC